MRESEETTKGNLNALKHELETLQSEVTTLQAELHNEKTLENNEKVKRLEYENVHMRDELRMSELRYTNLEESFNEAKTKLDDNNENELATSRTHVLSFWA